MGIIRNALKIKKEREDIKRWPVHIYAQASNVSKHANDLASIAYTIKYERGLSEHARAELFEELKEKSQILMAANIRFLERLKMPTPEEEPVEKGVQDLTEQEPGNPVLDRQDEHIILIPPTPFNEENVTSILMTDGPDANPIAGSGVFKPEDDDAGAEVRVDIDEVGRFSVAEVKRWAGAPEPLMIQDEIGPFPPSEEILDKAMPKTDDNAPGL
jgi:hypothetical protein